MKPIKTTLLCAALALTFGLPALGEEVAAKKLRATTRESRTAKPEAAPDAKDYSELSGQVVYQVLLAEMALQRGKGPAARQDRIRQPGLRGSGCAQPRPGNPATGH